MFLSNGVEVIGMRFKRLTSIILVICVLLAMITVSVSARSGVVNGNDGSLNMRSEPNSKNDNIIAVIPNGTVVTILGQTNNWYNVSCTVNGTQYTGYVYAAYIKESSDSVQTIRDDVPEVYKDYINKLKKQHPNWKFKFLYTELDWNDVVKAETRLGVSAIDGPYNPLAYRSTTVNYTPSTGLSGETSGSVNMRTGAGTSYEIIVSVPKGTRVSIISEVKPTDNSTSKTWYNVKCTVNKAEYTGYISSGYVKNVGDSIGTYTPIEGSNWFQAHGQVIRYYLDPRNFMNDRGIFQFERIKFNESAGIEGIESILKNTFMENMYIKNDAGEDITYAQAIMTAADTYKVSSYYLASRIKNEVSAKGNIATTGTDKDYPGIYNFYSVGAYTGAKDGLKWAANPANSKYGTPWTSQYKSIMGGALYIAKNYINAGQDTYYSQKFDVVATGGLYNHQYMTNIQAPSTEAGIMYNTYTNAGQIDFGFEFIIPVYKNMPSAACALPSENLNSPNLEPDISTGNPVTPVDIKFPDVAKTAWYYDSVNKAVQNGYFSGYQDGTFGPGKNIIRQDFAVVLAKADKANLETQSTNNLKFPDTDKNAYYAKALSWCVGNGIVSGYANGRFGPADAITREQICVMVYKYLTVTKGNADSLTDAQREELLASFKDGDEVSDWARNAVAWCISNKIISGAEGGTLINARANANRAEIATIFVNMNSKGLI